MATVSQEIGSVTIILTKSYIEGTQGEVIQLSCVRQQKDTKDKPVYIVHTFNEDIFVCKSRVRFELSKPPLPKGEDNKTVSIALEGVESVTVKGSVRKTVNGPATVTSQGSTEEVKESKQFEDKIDLVVKGSGKVAIAISDKRDVIVRRSVELYTINC